MRIVTGCKINFAFTLAEVLVVLMVIGILATTTIPGLLQSINEQELKTAFKKTYSDLAQATQKVMQDNGGTMLGLCPDLDHNCLKNKYVAHLNVTKNCDLGQIFGNCWHTNNKGSWYLNGPAITGWIDTAGSILNNGSFLRPEMYDDACKLATYSLKGDCGRITVDVNGFKKPNTVGKDIFFIHVYNNGIARWGVPDDDTINASKSATCKKTSTGHGCAALVLQDIDY